MPPIHFNVTHSFSIKNEDGLKHYAILEDSKNLDERRHRWLTPYLLHVDACCKILRVLNKRSDLYRQNFEAMKIANSFEEPVILEFVFTVDGNKRLYSASTAEMSITTDLDLIDLYYSSL